MRRRHHNGEQVKLRLSDVTLVAAETGTPDLTRAALQDCVDRVDFADVLVFSDEKVLPGAQWHLIPKIKTVQEATAHYWYSVPQAVDTSHFLIIQWDAWIINASAWNDKFLTYDYVGAPWWRVNEPHNVGNGGFSLRSTRLMRHIAANRETFPFQDNPEDDTICRRYAAALEAENFTFAPTETAIHFAFERLRPTNESQNLLPTFGFHGMFNWPDALSDDQIAKRLEHADARILGHEHFFQMNHELSRRGRRTFHKPPAGKIYAA